MSLRRCFTHCLLDCRMWVLSGLLLTLAVGCTPATPDPGPGTSDPGTTDPGTTDPGTTDPGTTDPGTTDPGTTDPGTTDPGEPEVLLEPFDPPALADLEAKVEWDARPVVDAVADLRKWKAEHDPPKTSAADALKMKNTGPEANAKILNALSQLAPADGKGVNFDATFSRAFTQDLRSTNPLLISSTAESEINSLTGFGLFSFDKSMVPFAISEAVVSWHTSKDRMYDKLVIRDDLLWSDGKPITAHDIVFSFKTIMNPKVLVPAVRQGTDELKWVEAYDDHTLVYFQKEARAINDWNLNFPVIPKHIYEKSVDEDPSLRKSSYHVEQEEHPVVGGPYEIVERVRGQHVLLRRRENYYMVNGKQVRDKPYFKEIKFRIAEDPNTRLLALKAGEIEEAELGAEAWKTRTNDDAYYKSNTKVTGREWTFFYVGYNLKSPYFSDKRVRQAMSLALNHQEMLDDLCYGLYQPCYGIFHPESWMYPKPPTAKPDRYNHQDLDKAEELLDAAGWGDSDGDGYRDKGGKRFEFTLLVSNKQDRIDICNLFREDLDTIGVICNVAPLEAATLQERMLKKNFHAAMAGWGAGADPYTNENIFGTGKERNYGSYSNKAVDKLFQDGMAEFDRGKRAKIYGRIHEHVYEDQPYTFLYYRSSFYGFNKKLRGYNFSPRGPFHYGPGISALWSP